MAKRQVSIPDEIHKVYAIGHCVPIVAAVSPEKLINSTRLSENAHRFLSPSIYEGKIVPIGGARISDEEITKAAPNLIIMENADNAIDQASRLEARLHIPVLLIDQSMTKYKEAFSFLGKVLNASQQAKILNDFVTTYLDPIPAKARSIPESKRVRVYYAEGPDGLSTNPAGSSHTEALEYVGGINAAKVSNVPGEGNASVSIEQLYIWQPDLILVWTPAADQLVTWHTIKNNSAWRQLDAVKKDHVVQIPWLPLSWFDRPPGSNRIIGTIWLAQLLYPNLYRFDLLEITQEYFRKFYHYNITEADAHYLLSLASPDTLSLNNAKK